MKNTGLRAIALLEGAKGIVALMVGVGVYTLEGVDLHQLVDQVAHYLDVDPKSYYLSMLQHLLDSITNESLMIVTIIALLYSLVRFVEAYGLWKQLRWVEWFALLSGAIYLPFEVYEVMNDLNLISGGVLAINLVVVIYIYRVVKQKPKRSLAPYVMKLPDSF
ncbi:DUF2127 domain-containing protein [Marinomonas transparens]|uniref:DUF2127 domain-containing protein n=1 Tax=Marinomonas transparens TaxID=2795388 RepID=A0A934JJN3_9GAMM|nr:DUF2127 domain-containing protein [Marinomonas transparens]MBJ7537330.1 DUF2127 domain-containing protein [Marinomonas transparens]